LSKGGIEINRGRFCSATQYGIFTGTFGERAAQYQIAFDIAPRPLGGG
jgi:hypothetical protein